MKVFVLLFSIIAVTKASYCGPYSVPYSLEYAANDTLVLGCTRSPCLSVSPSHETSVKYSSFQGDGFVRYDSVRETTQAYGNVVCQQAYGPQSCSGPNQWLGGIAPGAQFSNQTFQVLCCEYSPLQLARTMGVASLSPGQIYTGGDVNTPGELPSFDYIADVQRGSNPDGSITYNAVIKRLSCLASTSQPSRAAARADPIYPGYSNYPGRSYYGQPAYGQSYYGQPAYGQSYAASSSSSSFYCFSGDSTVQLADGGVKRMDELQVGDWIQTAQGNKIGATEVTQWIHRKTSEETDFLNIELENGKTVKMTAQHYIFKAPCDEVESNMEANMLFAEELEAGDCVYVKRGGKVVKSRIASIKETQEVGYYAPLTTAETLFVNDIFVSCNSNFKNNVIRKSYNGVASQFATMMDKFEYTESGEVDLIPGFKTLVAFGKSFFDF